jgi:hypothetical protein
MGCLSLYARSGHLRQRHPTPVERREQRRLRKAEGDIRPLGAGDRIARDLPIGTLSLVIHPGADCGRDL